MRFLFQKFLPKVKKKSFLTHNHGRHGYIFEILRVKPQNKNIVTS